MLTLKLAFRSLWRQKFRTIITFTGIAFGTWMMLVFMALGDGAHELMIDIGIRQGAGHVVVQAEGWQKRRSVELLVTNPTRVRTTILEAHPKATVAIRAYGGGLIKTPSDTVGAFFVGVEPGVERKVHDLPKRVMRGVYLAADDKTIAKAEKKKGELWCARNRTGAGRVRPAVIGVRMAKTLRVKLCDKIVIDAQGLAEQESQQFRVVGIFQTGGAELDAYMAHLPLGDVQKLLHIGQGVHQVAVFVGGAHKSHAVARSIRRLLPSKDLEVLPWDKALPELAQYVWLDDAGNYIFFIIIFVIIFIGVLNTVLMAVMERTRELGLIRALGARPWRIGALVLAESAFIGLLGIGLGLLLAWPVNHYLSTTGLDLSQWFEKIEGAGVAITGIIYSKVHVQKAINGCLIVFVMTLVSAIYPALRAMYIKVLKAVHHA